MPAAAGKFLQGRIHKHPAIGAFDGRRLAGSAQRLEDFPALVGFRVEPGEGDKVLVEKLAHGIRVAATARTNDTQAKHAQLRQKLSAARERDNQLFTQAGNAIEQAPEMAARHAPNTRLAPSHRRSRSPDDRSGDRCRRKTGPVHG